MLFRRYVKMVLVKSSRLLGDPVLAEDVAQETFAAAFAKIRTLKDPSAFRPWLLQIAVRYVQQALRKRRLRTTLGLEQTTSHEVFERLSAPHVSPELRAELALLDRALTKLKPKLRIPWVLRHVEGEQLEDIAKICDCSLATIKRRLSKADALVKFRMEASR